MKDGQWTFQSVMSSAFETLPLSREWCQLCVLCRQRVCVVSDAACSSCSGCRTAVTRDQLRPGAVEADV